VQRSPPCASLESQICSQNEAGGGPDSPAQRSAAGNDGASPSSGAVNGGQPWGYDARLAESAPAASGELGLQNSGADGVAADVSDPRAPGDGGHLECGVTARTNSMPGGNLHAVDKSALKPARVRCRSALALSISVQRACMPALLHVLPAIPYDADLDAQ